MTKNSVLKIINPILGILLVNQALTGIFADKIFARSPEAFEVLHEGGGYLFAALCVLHVILNWAWVKANFFRKKPVAKA